MVQRKAKWVCSVLLSGGLLVSGCPINSDDIQQAVADNAENLITDLFTTALNEILQELFDLDS